MTATLARSLRSDTRWVLIFAGVVGLDALASCLIPRATVPLLILTCVVLLAAPTAGPRGTSVLSQAAAEPANWIAYAFLLYLFANASWSLDPTVAYRKAATVLSLYSVWFIAVSRLRQVDGAALSRAAAALLIGSAAGASYLVFEVLSDLTLERLLYNAIPILRPESSKHLITANGLVQAIGPYKLNQNLALLVLFSWSALAVLLNRPELSARRWLALAFVVLVGLAVAASEHETSQLAFVGGLLVFFLSRWSSRVVRRALAVLWCLAFVLVIPLSHFAYRTAGLHNAGWLPDTARARIIIWGYTAQQIPKAPILGIGMRSTRVLDKRQLAVVEKPTDHIVAPRPGRHAHNLFLQSWFELGAVGVAFLMAAGLLVMHRIARLADPVQPYANALFAAFAIVATFAWGIWQSWLLAGYALTALFLLLADRFVAARHPGH
ncbi:MAG: O-antigen ligase family protein [Methyloligellaceae bacterium]